MCGASGKYIHVGFNTQDIHDLAVSLQIKAGLDLIERELNATRDTLVKLCKEYKFSVMIGRKPQPLPSWHTLAAISKDDAY
jgi:3-carboxy-cis,cis-muconate cycloisomerase